MEIPNLVRSRKLSSQSGAFQSASRCRLKSQRQIESPRTEIDSIGRGLDLRERQHSFEDRSRPGCHDHSETVSAQNRDRRAGQNLKVACQRPMLDVFDVHAHHLIE